MGGKMSQFLNNVSLNENIKVRGPFGKLTYLGEGNFKILTKYKPLTYREKKYKKVGMLAGGTGITPFYQVINLISNIFILRFFKLQIFKKMFVNFQ